MKQETKVLLVIGIIGFILMMVGVGSLTSISLETGIVMLVVGFILLVIATKGEILLFL